MFGQHGWARISTLYGFNTVVVVGLLQVVVLINEAFPFDYIIHSMLEDINASELIEETGGRVIL